MSIQTCFCSSLAKILPLRAPDIRVKHGCALRGERFSFQLAYSSDKERGELTINASCALPLRKRAVALVPVQYPDLLSEFETEERQVVLFADQWRSIWFTVDVPRDCKAGTYPVDVEVIYRGYLGETETRRMSYSLEVLDAELPPQSLTYTCWIHTDCLADYYGFPVFSEAYWRTVEQFVRNAAVHGMNMLLTPLVTPPLDTEVGRERPTVRFLAPGALDNDGQGLRHPLFRDAASLHAMGRHGSAEGDGQPKWPAGAHLRMGHACRIPGISALPDRTPDRPPAVD